MNSVILSVFLLTTLCCEVMLKSTLNEEVEYKKLAKACKDEYKVTAAQMKELQGGSNKQLADVSKDLKCSMNCFLGKMGILNPTTGDILIDDIEKRYPHMNRGLAVCMLSDATEPCDIAFSIISCLLEQTPSIMDILN